MPKPGYLLMGLRGCRKHRRSGRMPMGRGSAFPGAVQYQPVRIAEDTCQPREGPTRARLAIAARIVLVAVSLARSACDAALRSRQPSPAAVAERPGSTVRRSGRPGPGAGRTRAEVRCGGM